MAEMTDNKETNFTFERSVNYYETDRMGIVHHSNYIRWMEEARIELLAAIGMPYHEMEAAGVMIPVLSASCEYRKSFQFGDTAVIHVYPLKYNGIKMTLKYKIYHKATGELHSEGETGHCFLDNDRKLIHLKKEYPRFHEKFEKWYQVDKTV